jgi:hypothetical protein
LEKAAGAAGEVEVEVAVEMEAVQQRQVLANCQNYYRKPKAKARLRRPIASNDPSPKILT